MWLETYSVHHSFTGNQWIDDSSFQKKKQKTKVLQNIVSVNILKFSIQIFIFIIVIQQQGSWKERNFFSIATHTYIGRNEAKMASEQCPKKKKYGVIIVIIIIIIINR